MEGTWTYPWVVVRLAEGMFKFDYDIVVDDGGYLDLSPGSSTTSGSMTQLRPERMQSYISDDTDSFPKRAYSVGSNPVKTRQAEQGYMDMTGELSSQVSMYTAVLNHICEEIDGDSILSNWRALSWVFVTSRVCGRGNVFVV